MPRGDGTGPMGLGPMTGRGAGYCTGYPSPGFMNSGFRRGYFGWGRGQGWRRWSQPIQPQKEYYPTKNEEKEILNQELKSLKQEITFIEKQLQDLKGQKK